jgi:hypothetical protein
MSGEPTLVRLSARSIESALTRSADLHNFTATDPVIGYFWRAVRSFTLEERAKVRPVISCVEHILMRPPTAPPIRQWIIPCPTRGLWLAPRHDRHHSLLHYVRWYYKRSSNRS